jgi:hypothetical protein
VNEIKILVRTQNSSKAGFEDVNKDIDKFAKDSSETFSKTFNENLSRTFTTRINEAVTRSEAGLNQAGNRIGDTLGRQISTRITENIRNVTRDSNGRLHDERGRFISDSGSGGNGGNGGRDHESVTVHDRNTDHVKVNVDVDKQSLMSKLAGFGKEAGQKFGDFFKDGWRDTASNIFSGDIISTIVKGLAAAGLGVALAPVLAAAVNGAVLTALGGGVIAIGIVGALKDPRIQVAVNGVKDQLKGMFTGFSENFKGPLENFLVGGVGGGPGLLGVLKSLQPTIDSLGETFGRVTQGLGNGIIGFLQNALPPIARAAEVSAPLWNELADQLPGLGDAVGKFFNGIKNGSPGATLFIRDFLEALERIIPLLGRIIGGLSNMYLNVRHFFAQMKVEIWNWAASITDAAAVGLSWVPGLGPKLRIAQGQIHKFQNDANRELRKINDIDIEVRIRTIGAGVLSTAVQAYAQLKKLGYGKAAGGVAGGIGQAASGGARSNLTWVGEQGPELVDIAPGSRVHTAGDSQRMAGQGGQGGGNLVAVARLDHSQAGQQDMMDVLMRMLRVEIFRVSGGDVQMALGS